MSSTLLRPATKNTNSPFTTFNDTTNISEFNEKYNNYKTLETPHDYVNENIIETRNILNRQYILLIIWFIITVIIVTITIIGLLSTELNNYILYPTLGFLIYILFYIFKNIYNYFKK